uniref:Uncharacterized protein n=1 Tax=Rhizophora mucronata TaxID=61149 RepID=A0A2P2QD10_RHIMU
MITVSAKPAALALSNSALVILVARRTILGNLCIWKCPFCFQSSSHVLVPTSSSAIHKSFSTRTISGWKLFLSFDPEVKELFIPLLLAAKLRQLTTSVTIPSLFKW